MPTMGPRGPPRRAVSGPLRAPGWATIPPIRGLRSHQRARFAAPRRRIRILQGISSADWSHYRASHRVGSSPAKYGTSLPPGRRRGAATAHRSARSARRPSPPGPVRRARWAVMRAPLPPMAPFRHLTKLNHQDGAQRRPGRYHRAPPMRSGAGFGRFPTRGKP